METTALLLIGLFAGFLGGMLGIGGSLIMIPAMTMVLGPNQHRYQAAAMIANVFVAIPAVYLHGRAGAIDVPTVKRLLPVGLVAVVAGVLLSEMSFFAGDGESYLRALFGAFLFAVVGVDLFRIWRDTRRARHGTVDAQGGANAAHTGRAWARAASVALPTGLIAGLLGVGGGAIAVPLQRRLLHAPLRVAIANTVTLMVATAAVGAIVKNHAYYTDQSGSLQALKLAALLSPMAVVGSLVGSTMTHRLPLRVVKTVFLVVLLVVAVRLSWDSVS